MKGWLRDWWRGWSDEDLANVLRKTTPDEFAVPGMAFPISNAEFRAYLAYHRDQVRR